MEQGARGGDHALVEFHDVRAQAREAPVEELGERAAAQADHQRAPRLRMEQQERHHAARVVELERERILQAHRALDRLAADVQVRTPRASLTAIEGFVFLMDFNFI